MTDYLAHGRASRLVAHWRAPRAGCYTAFETEAGGHTLVFPGGGYMVAVTFSRVVDHPELMRISSTNWRCEDEPNGIFKVEDARRFWTQLKRAGFEVQQ